MLNNILQNPIFSYEFLNNTIYQWSITVLAFIGFLIIFKIFQSIILFKLNRLAKKTKTDIDDTIIKIVKTLRPGFYIFIAFYLALKFISLEAIAERVIDVFLTIWIVYQIIKALHIAIDYTVEKALKKDKMAGSKDIMGFISKLSKTILWALGALVVLSNLGVNVTSLIAGLGIGGLAIALALQNILSDLFGSFAIYFDKPFVPGDFIVVKDKMGVVVKIGIKTTRIKSIQGEEIVIPNKELTSAVIQNFQKLKERRVALKLGVIYDTPNAKLKKIPTIIKDIIKSVKGTRFDRAHFYKFDDSALMFEVIYYALTDDYAKYMDINQEIHYSIKQAFENENISMAYPTQTIYLEK